VLPLGLLGSGRFWPTVADSDPEQTFREMQQAHEFRLYCLMEINNPKDHRLGNVWQAVFAGKSASTFIQS
tara:strand:- start:4685 stop:4894 length:210 start_codon:yes stop_codon:yes gene_type:complete